MDIEKDCNKWLDKNTKHRLTKLVERDFQCKYWTGRTDLKKPQRKRSEGWLIGYIVVFAILQQQVLFIAWVV